MDALRILWLVLRLAWYIAYRNIVDYEVSRLRACQGAYRGSAGQGVRGRARIVLCILGQNTLVRKRLDYTAPTVDGEVEYNRPCGC